MNTTTEYPPQGLLQKPPGQIDPDPPGQMEQPFVGGGTGSDVMPVPLVFITCSIVFLLIFVVVIFVFLRKCRKNRKIYIPVNLNIARIENQSKPVEVPSHNHVSDIFQSLVGKETDDEDETSEIHTTSHCEGIDLNPSHNFKGSSASPTNHVPSRESKHSRSLPSLKHLSAHEEALSYLALGHPQSTGDGPRAKLQTSSGVFDANNDGVFIRSRSFNERIAFGLNISRHSLNNRNRINVTALNRCMTTNEPDSKARGKESLKTRKDVRRSFIKSMRISNLVEFIPTSFNIRKRIGQTVGRYRKSMENSRIPPSGATASPFTKNRSFEANSIVIPIEEIPDESIHSPRRVGLNSNFLISPSLNSEKLLESFSRCENFLDELGFKTDQIQRSKSCVVLVAKPEVLKPNHVALRTGNAISFDQLEEYSKRFTG